MSQAAEILSGRGIMELAKLMLMRKVCGKAQISTIGVRCKTINSILTDSEHFGGYKYFSSLNFFFMWLHFSSREL
jgi:hypothetical protein